MLSPPLSAETTAVAKPQIRLDNEATGIVEGRPDMPAAPWQGAAHER